MTEQNLSGPTRIPSTYSQNVTEFMESRISELQELGWNEAKIAEALGVEEDFVEEVIEEDYFELE